MNVSVHLCTFFANAVSPMKGGGFWTNCKHEICIITVYNLYFVLPHFLYVWVPIQMEIKPSSQMDILCYGSTHTHTVPMHARMHAHTQTHS